MANGYNIGGIGGTDELVGEDLVGDELVGGDEEVGRGRFGSRSSGAPAQRPPALGSAPGQQFRPRNAQRVLFKKLVGAGAVTIPPGGQQQFTLTPTTDFRGERLVIARKASGPPGTDTNPQMPTVVLASFKVGNNDQLVGGAGVSIDAFAVDAVGMDLKCNTCPPNQNITFSIFNGSTDPVTVQPSLFGTSIE